MVLASEEKLPGPSWPWLAETQLALSHRKESTSTSPKGELIGELENATEKKWRMPLGRLAKLEIDRKDLCLHRNLTSFVVS